VLDDRVYWGRPYMLPMIVAGARPNSPIIWERSQSNINLAWHHVLPFCELGGFWNNLVMQCYDTHLPEARTALRHYLLLCNRKLFDVDTWIDRIRKQDLEVAECGWLATTAVWPAWNIVEGPATRLRTDDPGDRFIDRYTHGLTRK
jgi:hypothetical protein